MNHEPLQVIADKRSSEGQLCEVIQNLGPVEERPEFWLGIAGDESYSRVHRRHSMFQLSYRHVAPGLTLGQLALLCQRLRES